MVWVIVGFLGQAMFSLRFLIQWLASERAQKSVIPVAFWYFSILGSLILLIYAIHRKDPVFIVGQSVGSFIYFRNLVLIKRNKESNTANKT
ncbi:MAG: hypothetical protein PWR10_1010 [Halanaerobiales bacterium]|nr:hypothetical protein [Halanaerobiales bacterium]